MLPMWTPVDVGHSGAAGFSGRGLLRRPPLPPLLSGSVTPLVELPEGTWDLLMSLQRKAQGSHAESGIAPPPHRLLIYPKS